MTNKAKQLAVRMETYAKFPYLIEIKYENANGNEIIERYANCGEDVEFTDSDGETKTFYSAYFKIKPPSRSNSSISNGTFTYTVVDQTWITKIRQCKKRAKIRFLACIIYDDNNNIQTVEKIDDINFTLTKCSWNEKTVQWVMMFDDRMNLNIPVDTATIRKVPALS